MERDPYERVSGCVSALSSQVMSGSSMSSAQVAEFITKMRNVDKDFRYMALNDLLAELTKPRGQLDDVLASRLVDAVLKTLEDANGEVQNMGVKCLGPLIKRSNESYVQVIVDRLCKADGAEALKDISATALRTVISELSPTSPLADSITSKLTPRLLSKLEKPEDKSDLLLETIDVLQELLSRFGRQVAQLPEAQLTRMVHALTKLLDNSRSAVRKRSIVSLGLLSIHLPTGAHDRFMSELLELLPLAKTNDRLKTLIGLLGQISRSEATLPPAARRFSSFLQSLATPTLSALAIDDDELRETALLSLEAFVINGGQQIRKFDSQILDACFNYIKYDPNYSYDDNADADVDMAESDEASDFGSDYDETYSDDDDLSWKIRKASARLLQAVISTRPDTVRAQGAQITQVLISRLNEREETVSLEIVSIFATLVQLETTPSTLRAGSPSRKRNREQDQDMELETKTLRTIIVGSINKISKILQKHISGKSAVSKPVAFNALAALARLCEPEVEQALFSMLLPTKQALASTAAGHNATASSAIKLAALDFVQTLIEHASRAGVTSYTEELMTLLASTLVNESLYKVAATALDSCVALLLHVSTSGDTNAYNIIWSTILSRSSSDKLDHELRDRLIRALGKCLLNAPAGASEQLAAESCTLLLQRLESEGTRLAALHGIAEASAAKQAKLQASWAADVIRIATPFTRNMSDKGVRAASLVVLPSLLPLAGDSLKATEGRDLATSMTGLLKSGDVQILPPAIQVLGVLARDSRAESQQLIHDHVFPAVLALLDSQAIIVGGPALDELLSLLSIVAVSGDAQRIIATMSSDLSGKNLPILARCIAACLKTSSDALISQKKAISAPKTPEDQRTLALYVVGEYAASTETDKTLADLVLTQFSSPSDQVKAGAAFALGRLSARDLDASLPVLFGELAKGSSDHFLLALSLKEVIAHNAQEDRAPTLLAHSDAIWEKLFQAAGDDRAKATLAECVGRLTMIHPSRYLPQLQTRMQSDDIAVRSVVIRAVRYTFTAASAASFDDLLRPFVVDFLSMMEDADLEIRRLALSTLYSAAFHKPQLIHDHIARLLPLLYRETVVNQELLHTVQMGPFKHVVDDGLVLRKSAFETLHTLTESFFSVSEMQGIYEVVSRGLDDVHEIKMLSYLMLSTLASKDSEGVRQHLEELAPKMVKVMASKPKENAVKADREKDSEIKRSVLRCAAAIKTMCQPETPAFAAFWQDMEASRQGEIQALTLELRGSL
jgi:cullin-associated NEDD8-dissociated protein 1